MSNTTIKNNPAQEHNDNLLMAIQNNWKMVISLVDKIENPETKAGALELCDKLQDRFAVCPASTQYVGCFVGGLVWHSLNVIRIMKDMRKVMGLEKEVHADSVITLGLFHDLGKLGNETDDFYEPQTSSWHREKLGQMYQIRPTLTYIPVATRSLWWLNRFNIWLSENEIHALNTLNVKNNEALSFNPSLRDPMEAFLLQTAVRGCCLKYGGIKSLLDTE